VAIDNLIDSVDGFPFTSTATQHEDAGDEMKLVVIGNMLAMVFTVLAQDDLRDAHGLSAVTAYDTAKLLRREFNRHGYCSFYRFDQARELGEYRMAREFVHREDNNQLRKREVMVSGEENICNSIYIK
jgi:hypothetical protein